MEGVTDVDALAAGNCMGQIAGISFLAHASTKGTALDSCRPEQAPRGQTLNVIVRYLQNHPEKQHDNFSWLALDALHEAWPCRLMGRKL